MTFIKFKPVNEFENNINNNFQKVFGEFPGMEFNYAFNPRIDVFELNDKVYVEAELPGSKKDDIQIKVQENTLTISGEKKKDSNEDKNVLRNERIFGSFSRSFNLSEEINAEDIEANFENGILTIALGKVKEEKPKERTIDIK